MHSSSKFKESKRQTKESLKKQLQKSNSKDTNGKWEKALQPSRKHFCFSVYAGVSQTKGGITVA